MQDNEFQLKESFKSKQEAVEYAEKINKAYSDLKESFQTKLNERFDKLEKLLADQGNTLEKQSQTLETQGKALDDLKTDNSQLAREVLRLNKRVVGLEREAINANQYGRCWQLELLEFTRDYHLSIHRLKRNAPPSFPSLEKL